MSKQPKKNRRLSKQEKIRFLNMQKRIVNVPFSRSKILTKAIIAALVKLKFVSRKKNTVTKNIDVKNWGSWYFYRQQRNKIKENLKKDRYISHLKKNVERTIKDFKKEKVYTLKKNLNETSILDPRFFKPWRYKIPFITIKQRWLKNQYSVFKNLSLKNRTDFFQTQMGQMMLFSFFSFPVFEFFKSQYEGNDLRDRYQFPVTKIYNIMARLPLFSSENLNQLQVLLDDNINCVSRKKIYTDLNMKNEMSWFYENTLRTPYSITYSKFKLTKFPTAFHSNYREIKKRPWVEPLFFKRAALSSFEERYRKVNKFAEKNLQYKFYLRNKNPRHIKRNRLYKRKTKLLANTWKKKRIVARKIARIQQIVSKLLRPFYGHLTLKQWTALIKKSKKSKKKYQTRTETILQHLENRLDITVYRLNWAPSVMWARRLIRGGFIFVTNTKKTNSWNKMYACFKKYSFPLKLRDPKSLYCHVFWNPKKKKSKQKFFYFPQKKVSYLVQIGDVIQCSRSVFMNQFKNNTIWLQKPVSSRFLLGKRYPRTNWRWDSHQVVEKDFNNFEFPTDHRKSAIVLSKIKMKNLPKTDRSTKRFLRWIIS